MKGGGNMIEVKHIWFSYEQWGEFVLKDISFSVEKGEIVGVLGANGVGKTTLLKVLAGLLPPVGNFFASLPESVLGGCTIMMFGTIMTSGMQMLAKAGFNQRNVTIAALSLAVGVGFTAASEIDLWHIFPEIVQSVFSANVVAVAFVVSIILNLVLPKNMDVDKISE